MAFPLLPSRKFCKVCMFKSLKKKKRLIEIEKMKPPCIRTAAEPRGRVGSPEEVLEWLDPLVLPTCAFIII